MWQIITSNVKHGKRRTGLSPYSGLGRQGRGGADLPRGSSAGSVSAEAQCTVCVCPAALIPPAISQASEQ